MKRASSLLAALAPLAVAVGIAAANASATAVHPSISLAAPSTLPAGVNFHVTVSGQAKSSGTTFIGVDLVWNIAGCPATAFDAENYPTSYMFHFHNGQGIGAKVSGSFHVRTSSTKWEGSKTKAYLCGYLYGGHKLTTSPPTAHTQLAIHFKS